jgi:hypothetical protein
MLLELGIDFSLKELGNMLKTKEWHKQGEKRTWRNGTIKYNKHLGWVYHEKGSDMDTVIYAYLMRDVKKIFPDVY